MIERGDILSIPYLKKAVFTGSYEGMRFRLAAIKKERPGEQGEGAGGGEQILEFTAWEGPYAYDATPEEKKQRMETEFSESGIRAGIAWLNALWEAEPERWRAAKSRW